jgi:hypothetical protein
LIYIAASEIAEMEKNGKLPMDDERHDMRNEATASPSNTSTTSEDQQQPSNKENHGNHMVNLQS